MTRGWKIATGGVALAVLGGVWAALVARHSRKGPITLMGAVIRQGADTGQESPIADVGINAANGLAAASTQSDFSGFFRLPLRPEVRRGRAITLQFRHPGYQPLDLHVLAGDELYIARLTPRNPEAKASPAPVSVVVSDVLVRYSVESNTVVSIGTGVKTFQVVNTANVPCVRDSPCSPDGKWKAAVGSASLDAGAGNVFGNPRVSCIAGPCPFTKINSEELSQDGRTVKVTARAWSDTATFLLQAEVFHSAVSNTVRVSYPVIFGQALNFSLPAAAQGPSLDATLSGVPIVFPLPPNALLSWADCKVSLEKDRSKLYRCELKPGYRFP
jgi:hypothetical protein